MGGSTEGVSDDDHFGIAGDARNGRGDEAAAEDARGVPVEASSVGQATAAGERPHGGAVAQVETGLAEEILLGIQHTEWAGPLPPPEMLHAYTAEEQQKILAWSDAKIIDESRRSDKLVDAVVESTKREQWFNFASAIVPTMASFAAFIVTGDPLSLTFLAVPGVTIAVNVIGAVRNNGGSDDE